MVGKLRSALQIVPKVGLDLTTTRILVESETIIGGELKEDKVYCLEGTAASASVIL